DSSLCPLTGEQLASYAMFEKWQGSERMLDDAIKIHKLIKLWKSLPGHQLASVKFLIKPKRNYNNKYSFCALSPDTHKSGNHERIKRNKTTTSCIKNELLINNANSLTNSKNNNE